MYTYIQLWKISCVSPKEAEEDDITTAAMILLIFVNPINKRTSVYHGHYNKEQICQEILTTFAACLHSDCSPTFDVQIAET